MTHISLIYISYHNIYHNIIFTDYQLKNIDEKEMKKETGSDEIK